MKSGFKKIVWTDYAEEELAQTLRYLERNFSKGELHRHAEGIESVLSMISQNPNTFPATSKRKNVHQAVVLRFNTLYYRVRKD